MTRSFVGKVILETPRLWIYETGPQDAIEAFQLNNDPEVLKYTGDEPFSSPSEAQAFLEAYDHFKRFGIGRWGLRLKSSEEYIGWCGLKKHPNEEVDLGFRLAKAFWNQGYATEASFACLNYGFGEHQFPYIIGRALPENKGSIRVLHKLGMKFWNDDPCDLEGAHTYRIERSEFKYV